MAQGSPGIRHGIYVYSASQCWRCGGSQRCSPPWAHSARSPWPLRPAARSDARVRGGAAAVDLQVLVPPDEDQPRRMVNSARPEFVLSLPLIKRATQVEVRLECTEVGGRHRRW